MTIRRVNSTGRKRILREDVQFFIRRDAEGGLGFDALLDLKDYKLPPDSKVFVEAYRQTSFMRFEYGSAAEPSPPSYVDRKLTEFSSPEGLLFRVKVTSTGERSGVLLAEGDRIPAADDEEQPNDRVPLLPPAPADLGQEIWRIDFAGSSGPLLLINKRVGDWKAVASSPAFRSLVYPAAMSLVLWTVFRDETRTTEDASDWRCRWLKFASGLPGVGDPPLKSEEEDVWTTWIEEAVASFARCHRMLDHYKASTVEADL